MAIENIFKPVNRTLQVWALNIDCWFETQMLCGHSNRSVKTKINNGTNIATVILYNVWKINKFYNCWHKIQIVVYKGLDYN